MEKTLEGTSHITGHAISDNLLKGLGWGFLGGLTGTLVMDLLLMGALLVLRQPATQCFSIVGDTVSRFFAMLGAQVAGGVATGVMTHYVVGPLFGILFGAAVTKLHVLRAGSLKQITIAAFLYVEILSQPILVTTPLLLKMKMPATLQWYGGAFLMHLIMSIVLGVIVGYGLQMHTTTSQRKARQQS
jgi:hypothetical protein